MTETFKDLGIARVTPCGLGSLHGVEFAARLVVRASTALPAA